VLSLPLPPTLSYVLSPYADLSCCPDDRALSCDGTFILSFHNSGNVFVFQKLLRSRICLGIVAHDQFAFACYFSIVIHCFKDVEVYEFRLSCKCIRLSLDVIIS
jgi:hypothetical protein